MIRFLFTSSKIGVEPRCESARLLIIPAVLLLMAGGTGSVNAQVSSDQRDGDSSRQIEEIIVTSTRRESRVQDVPQSITVLTGEALARRGIISVDQYALFVPGLNFNRTGFGDRGGLDLTFRGISNSRLADVSAGTAALTTGFYIDDIAVQPVDPFLYDVSRVEFLKGPQGTLFGQASMGGTVRVITNRPDASRFEASSEAKVAGTKDGDPSWALRGMINLPLVEDQLALRLVAYNDEEGGFIDWRPISLQAGARRGSFDSVPPEFPDPLSTVAAGIKHEDVNSKTARGARVALQYTPAEAWTIIPMFMYQEKHEDFLATIDRNLGGFVLERYVPTPRSEKFGMGGLTINYDTALATVTSVTGAFERELRFTQDTTTFLSNRFGKTADGGVASVGPLDFDFNTDIFSQEIRVASNDDMQLGSLGSVAWLVGAAYFDEERRTYSLWYAPTHNANAAPGNEIPGGDQGFVNSGFNPATFESTAVFGELTFKLLDDRLHLSAGARWYDQEFTLTGRSTGALSGVPIGTINQGALRTGDETGVIPRFTAKYYVSEDSMLFASAAEGFRGGGPGPAEASQQTPACLNALQLAGIEPGSSFTSDGLWTYEVGTKTSTSSGNLLMNAAVFYSDWTDLQTNLIMNNFDINCASTATTNAGNATSKGAEVELTGFLMPDLLLSAAVAYTKAELGEPPEGVAVGKEGDRLQNVPEWKVTFTGQYDFPILNAAYQGFVRLDASYTDDLVANQAEQDNPIFHVPEKFIVNLKLGFQPSSDESWSAELFIDNVTDELIIYGSQFLFGEPFTIQTQVGRPRTVGLVLRKSWGAD